MRIPLLMRDKNLWYRLDRDAQNLVRALVHMYMCIYVSSGYYVVP